ncbi:hypothetical protein B0H16DRAFT_1469891 [Mycena metata]|uniref:Uncharacterized protein n=1 Tax=Mycena metata TaxID=1033252 RepID=A0AAD7HWI1_9AGAR|nr:hypothetical protein B0H16DRAFT_1469891 [Mycena metata]
MPGRMTRNTVRSSGKSDWIIQPIERHTHAAVWGTLSPGSLLLLAIAIAIVTPRVRPAEFAPPLCRLSLAFVRHAVRGRPLCDMVYWRWMVFTSAEFTLRRLTIRRELIAEVPGSDCTHSKLLMVSKEYHRVKLLKIEPAANFDGGQRFVAVPGVPSPLISPQGPGVGTIRRASWRRFPSEILCTSLPRSLASPSAAPPPETKY